MFVETSRGCWWGERMHCTFCGLNGATMAFRSKSAPRALAELTHLAARHPGCDIQVVDNILDLKYFKTLLPELAERKLNVSLFYETKSNLKKDQVRLLRDAGVMTIQPGIESFSDRVLKQMKKGVSGLQNIQLLKWCKEIGVHPIWNFLMGFPGESPDDYFEMAELSARVCHLPQPSGRQHHPARSLQPELQRGRASSGSPSCGRCRSTSSSTICPRRRATTSRIISPTTTRCRRTCRATPTRWSGACTRGRRRGNTPSWSRSTSRIGCSCSTPGRAPPRRCRC